MNLPERYNERSTIPALAEERPFFQSGDDDITFSYLLSMLRRRLPLMAMVAALCFLLGVAWTLSSPRIYTAAADVVLIPGQQALVPGEEDNRAEAGFLRAEEIDTQISLLQSRTMASEVFDELDLGSDARFRADVLDPRSAVDNIRTSLGLDRTAALDWSPVNAGLFRDQGINYLMRAVRIERKGNAFTLTIAVADFEPGRAAQIANAYARLFTTDDARRRSARSQTAAQVLGERLEELRQQANADFAAVQSYRVANNLLSATATSLSEQEISTINQQIASARAEAARDAQSLATARSQLAGGAGNVGQGTASGVISSLRSQRAQLVTSEADLARRYLDRHPEVVTVREQIQQIDNQIAAEINREIQALAANAQASQQRLNSLLASRDGTRAQLRGDNTALVALADLERRASSSQALYESYLQRYNETLAGMGAEQPNARMISVAEVPMFPTSPNWPLMLALSIAVGLVLGTLIAILTEISYLGITTIDEAENRLQINGLGSIPAFRSIKPAGATPLDTVQEYPDGPFAESLRNVLVSIGRATAGRCEVIAVTSSIPGEGKTTLAACMGRAVAMASQSVVVVDCDIIRSQLSRMFDLTNGEPGLAEALADPDSQIAQYQESDSGMRILPISRPFRKGERLTEEGRLHQVVARLREQFDFVILDCPPILPIAETREIVALADHVVLAVAWRKTMDKIVRSAIRQLPRHVLIKTGLVLNMVDMRKQVRYGGSDAASFYKHYEAYYG